MGSFRIVPMIMLSVASCAWSAWQIEYSDTLVFEMRRAGSPIAKRVGHFLTKQACLDAIDQAVAQSGDPTLRLHMYPAPGGSDETGTSSTGGEVETQGRVWGEDGYGIPFYNLIRNRQQKALEGRVQKARELNLKGNEKFSQRDWSAAVTYYREALKATPDDPVIQQNLKNAEGKEKGQTLYRLGMQVYNQSNWQAAARYFQEALAASPGDPVIQQYLHAVEIMIASEKSSRMSQKKAACERDIENAVREKREAEQRKQLAEKDAALTDLQSAALDFLGKPAGAVEDSMSGQTPGQFHVPLPPSFPISTSRTMDRDTSPLIELPPLVYQVIGLIGQNIKEAPLKLGEAVITALGGGSQLSVIKITKGLSDEAGRSMQNAVDLIGRGYPEAETVNQIKGSEFRAMKIYVDGLSSLPTPLSQEEQQALEINGRRWFNWLTQQQEGGDK